MSGAWRRSVWRVGPGVALLHLLPKGLLSHAAGRLASLPLPRGLRIPLLRLFGRAVGIDFDEVQEPLDRYASLQAFFTRGLKSGTRSWDPDPGAVTAPCDGAWGQAGRVERGMLLQVKGRPYRLADLIGDEELATRMEGGHYATFYLSPRDYHRFHTPCAIRVIRATHIPGSLWPVNRIGVEGIEALYARNERICAHMRIANGGETSSSQPEADLCMVAVGATMVGKIRLTFDELTTHRRGGGWNCRDYSGDGLAMAKGAEWGHFEFGSTIVMIATPDSLALDVRPPATPLRLGERIGGLPSPTP